MSIIDCEHRGKINFKKGFSEWDINQSNVFCFCKRRRINVSKWFCVKCRSPGIPCPKCGNYTLQSNSVNHSSGNYQCYECKARVGWNKIKYLMSLAKKQLRKLSNR